MRCFGVFGVLLLTSLSTYADLKVAEPFPSLLFDDQFGEAHAVDGKDRMVVMAFDMDASAPLRDYLLQQEKGFLEAHGARYIADISAMPSLVSRMFALPKMRKYHFSILLNREEGFKEAFNVKEGALTVYRLDAGAIESIEFIGADGVEALFK